MEGSRRQADHRCWVAQSILEPRLGLVVRAAVAWADPTGPNWLQHWSGLQSGAQVSRPAPTRDRCFGCNRALKLSKVAYPVSSQPSADALLARVVAPQACVRLPCIIWPRSIASCDCFGVTLLLAVARAELFRLHAACLA
ncbi:hypothetical protein NDU88_007095 [Pleurodeles waltl]|uniref:Uncharacterized protein n=1 Tax=Pleurodeles waltl TaxID=8319 RepID=A0AAV7QJN2_PLEWA|nr:hypothetical protein NDU88_007095 [Pleurodeles waltl]